MTDKEAQNLQVGDYICGVTDIYKGVPTEGSQVLEPKKVTAVAYKGVCKGTGKDSGKHFVIFRHKSYLLGDDCNETEGCYGGEETFIVPTEEQRKKWVKGMKYKEFKNKTGVR